MHEIGHNVGIGHCTYYACCMNGAGRLASFSSNCGGHLEEDFSQPMHLCPIDLRKVVTTSGMVLNMAITVVGASVEERYEKLLACYQKFGLEEEREWVEKRLRWIKGETVATLENRETDRAKEDSKSEDEDAEKEGERPAKQTTRKDTCCNKQAPKRYMSNFYF